jgi:hypothetical protein
MDLSKKDLTLRTFEVIVTYPEEIMEIEAYSVEDAEEKAFELLGDVSINCSKVCSLEINEID